MSYHILHVHLKMDINLHFTGARLKVARWDYESGERCVEQYLGLGAIESEHRKDDQRAMIFLMQGMIPCDTIRTNG